MNQSVSNGLGFVAIVFLGVATAVLGVVFLAKPSLRKTYQSDGAAQDITPAP